MPFTPGTSAGGGSNGTGHFQRDGGEREIGKGKHFVGPTGIQTIKLQQPTPYPPHAYITMRFDILILLSHMIEGQPKELTLK